MFLTFLLEWFHHKEFSFVLFAGQNAKILNFTHGKHIIIMIIRILTTRSDL